MIQKAAPAVMVMLLCWAVSVRGGQSAPAAPAPPLPEGDTDLAAKYIGDFGIEKDPAVVFTDNFEGENNRNLRKKYCNVYDESKRLVTDDPANAHSGKTAMEITLPPSEKDANNGVAKYFSTGLDVLFVRYYIKFDKDDDFFNSAHDGVCIVAQATGDTIVSTPGQRADGKNKFMASLDTWRMENMKPVPDPPGEWIIYCYYPEQKGGFGDNFYPKRKFQVERNRWYCCELMLKANTVGQKDGRTAFWVDGKLIGDFPNLRLRDVDTLKINFITLNFYIMHNKVRENKLWYDDVVAATAYIGPMAKERKAPPPPVASTPKALVPAKPAVVLNAQDLAAWEGKLVQRVMQGVKDKEFPTVDLQAVGAREEPFKVTGADEKSLRIEMQGNTLPLPWARLTAGDRFRLARGFLKEHSLEDQLLVAVFALAEGDAELAEEHFALARVADPARGAALVAETRAALGLK